MNIFITGGTGFVGSALSKTLLEKGHNLKILTRRTRRDKRHSGSLSFIEGDPARKGKWMDQIAESDVVINLAGASIFKRWTKKYRETLRQSRILTTGNIVEALTGRKKDDVLLISTSAVGYYGSHGDENLYEDSPPGSDFLASLAQEWENEALKAEKCGAGVVICRLGIVLGQDGGAIHMMRPLFKYWLGSPLGNGRQYFSWIHIRDLIDIYMFLIDNKGINGAWNCSAPFPVTNRELTNAIASVMNKPLIMPPVPGFVIRLVMGEFADVLVKGQKVLPKRLMDSGYDFQFPEIIPALRDIFYG